VLEPGARFAATTGDDLIRPLQSPRRPDRDRRRDDRVRCSRGLLGLVGCAVPALAKSRPLITAQLNRIPSSSRPEGFSFPDSGSAAPVACALLYRKELHAVLAPVLPGSPSPRSRRSPTGSERHRAPGASAPGEGAPAAGGAPSTQPTRPSPAGGREPGDDEEQLVLVHRAAGDPAPLASGTRPEEVDTQRTGHPGRPPIEPDVRDLIIRLGRENPRWGYQRIRGELMKLEIRISATTVRTILLRAGLDPAPRRPGPTWTPVPEGHRRRGSSRPTSSPSRRLD
jgi:hypothetical protein